MDAGNLSLGDEKMSRNAAALLILAMVGVAGGCRWVSPGKKPKAEPPQRSPLQKEFTALCPLPRWWDRVEAPEIKTYGELMNYWRSKDRSPEQFFKAAFTAMRAYTDDPTIVVEAAVLLPYGDPNYPCLDKVYEFVLKHYADYRRSTVNYGGEPEDAVAQVVDNYAKILIGRGQDDKAVALIENLLREHESEINPHLLQLLAMTQARGYEKLGDVPKAVAVLQHAKEAYRGSWGESIQREIDRLQGK